MGIRGPLASRLFELVSQKRNDGTVTYEDLVISKVGFFLPSPCSLSWRKKNLVYFIDCYSRAFLLCDRLFMRKVLGMRLRNSFTSCAMSMAMASWKGSSICHEILHKLPRLCKMLISLLRHVRE